MPGNRNKTRSGSHKRITPTTETVFVERMDAPGYSAHLYICDHCGLKDTRRNMRRVNYTPQPSAELLSAAKRPSDDPAHNPELC